MIPTPCAWRGRSAIDASKSIAVFPGYPQSDNCAPWTPLYDQSAVDALQAEIFLLRGEVGAMRDKAAVAELAAQFTRANDIGDDVAEQLEDDGDDAALLKACEDYDDAYNRTKDALFSACRKLMGWPARLPKYPAPGPTPSAVGVDK